MNKQRTKLVSKRQPNQPSILDRDFKYIPSVATNVQETWKRFGWTPPSEARHESRT